MPDASSRAAMLFTIVVTASLLAAAIPAAADPRYFGLNVPHERPEPFRPTVFDSLGALMPTNPAYSPDYRRFAFTAVDKRTPGRVTTTIFESRFDGQRWSTPTQLNLQADGFNDAEPAFSPDGNWLYFTTNRHAGVPWDIKMFRARVAEDGYSGVERVNLVFLARKGTYYPQLTTNGSLLFTSNGSCEGCEDDLYIAWPGPKDSYGPAVAVDGDFNTKRHEWDLIERPDGRLRLWASGREGGAGRIDIYFSSKGADDRWLPAQNLAAVNSPAVETAPRLTPDGQVLFFQRMENGRDQIYWVRLDSVLQ